MNKTTTLLLVALGITLSVLFLWNPVQSMISGRTEISTSKGENKKGKKKKSESGMSDVSILEKWDMPGELVEISALAWLSKDRFACVQDEDGTVFFYNTADSRVENTIKFAGPGDYEGIAVANNAIYVMRADGRVFEINNYTAKAPVVTEYKTHLTVDNDVEALTFDAKNNRLLAAFKGTDDSDPGFKGVYSFDLTNKSMASNPVLKFASNTGGSSKKKSKGVQAADIAVHPVSQEIYIIDATGPSLKIINDKGEIKKDYTLDKKNFPQPEGITFSADGTLFISNEGKKVPGNILKVSLN